MPSNLFTSDKKKTEISPQNKAQRRARRRSLSTSGKACAARSLRSGPRRAHPRRVPLDDSQMEQQCKCIESYTCTLPIHPSTSPVVRPSTHPSLPTHLRVLVEQVVEQPAVADDGDLCLGALLGDPAEQLIAALRAGCRRLELIGLPELIGLAPQRVPEKRRQLRRVLSRKSARGKSASRFFLRAATARAAS